MGKDIFASAFGKETTKGINEFTQSYKCSEEEEKDALKYYTICQGNLDKMLECAMYSDAINKECWVEDYIKPAIDNGSVEDSMDQIQNSLNHNESSKKKKKKKKKKMKKKKMKKKRKKKKKKKPPKRKQKVEMEEEDDEENVFNGQHFVLRTLVQTFYVNLVE